MSEELKNGFEILVCLVGQAVFKLRSKTVKIMFWSTTQEPPSLYLNFNAIFEFLGKFNMRCIYYFTKSVNDFEIEEHAIFWLGVQYPLKGSHLPKMEKKIPYMSPP